MTGQKKWGLLVGAWMVGLASLTMAVPQYLTVQATLQGASGGLLSGPHVIKVGIYDGESLKWQETFSKTISRGIFSEILGKNKSDYSRKFKSI